MGATFHRFTIVLSVVAVLIASVPARGQSERETPPPVRAQNASAPQPADAKRQKDTIWNGFGWGFIAGVGFGTVTMGGYLTYDAIGADSCTRGPKVQCYVPMGLAFGAVGALIDWRIKGDSVAIAPEASPERKAVHLVVRF